MAMIRKDEPQKVELFHNAYYGGTALVVLGGLSAAGWQELRDEINPDVILGANGTCFEIPDLDIHLVVENLHLAKGLADRGDKRYQRIMEIISPANTAKVKMISFLNWERTVIVDDRVEEIKIKRMGELGDDYEAQCKNFSFREYGDGFLAGPMFNYAGALSSPRIKFRVGTVGTQLLHLAGILGVFQVHTIGFDLCFRDGSSHHWYKYPKYQPDKFRTNQMFTEFRGLKTQHDWLQGAEWLRGLSPVFERDGLEWVDHSNGLLEVF